MKKSLKLVSKLLVNQKKNSLKNKKLVTISTLYFFLAHDLALYMILAYATELPNGTIYPIIMKYVEKFGKSEHELERKAAVKVLGYICDTDSCLDMIKEDIDDITKFIVHRLKDSSVSIILNLSLVHCQRGLCRNCRKILRECSSRFLGFTYRSYASPFVSHKRTLEL